MKDKYTAYFDGFCYPEPMDDDMIIACVIQKDDFEIYRHVEHIPKGEDPTTANVARYLSLQKLYEKIAKLANADQEWELYTTNFFLARQMWGGIGIKEGVYVPFALKARSMDAQIREGRPHDSFSMMVKILGKKGNLAHIACQEKSKTL